MHRTVTACLFTALFAFAAIARPVDPAAIDRAAQETMRAWQIPGMAIAVVQDDRVVFVKGYGVKEHGGSAPVTADTLFQIGSTTKAFTTTAMAILVDEKKLSWDDPVRKHVDYFRLGDPCADSLVTLRDTVSHRTGLRRHDELWDNTPLTREDVVRRMGLVKLNKPFRSAYQYQNIMFIAAGEALESAAKMSWDDFVRTRIFEPLGMKSTRISVTDWNASDHASGHRWLDRDARVAFQTPIDDDNLAPAGSIKSSARDMAQWLRLQLGNGTVDGKKIVSPEAIGELWMPQTIVRMEGSTRESNPETNLMNYGLGWFVQDYRGELLVAHGGALNGFRASVAFLPKQKAGVVVLINLGRSAATSALRNSVLDLLLGSQSRDWNAHYLALGKKSLEEEEKTKRERESKRRVDAKPSRELAAYVGTYESPAYGEATVTLAGEQLTLRWQRITAPLTHYHFDTFDAVSEEDFLDEPVTFRLNAEGDVASLTMFGEEMKRK